VDAGEDDRRELKAELQEIEMHGIFAWDGWHLPSETNLHILLNKLLEGVLGPFKKAMVAILDEFLLILLN
jgi:hypothetical protein